MKIKPIHLFFPFAVAISLWYGFVADHNVDKHHTPLIIQGYDSIPDNYYIKDAFFESFSLKSTKKSPHMRVWDNPDKHGMYQTVNDIRYRFDNADRAAEDFEKNIDVHSEGGRELHPGIKIPGTTHLRIFRENKKTEDLMRSFGLKDVRFYYFLFLVDNVYVKVFLSVDKSVSIKEASAFAVEAANSVQAALGK